MVNAAFWTAVVLLFWGDAIFDKLGVQPPALYTFLMSYEDVRNSKMLVALGLFFFNSFAQQNLLKTGAFEVYYNSTPVYSKLASGLGNQVDLNEMIKGLKVAMGVEE